MWKLYNADSVLHEITVYVYYTKYSFKNTPIFLKIHGISSKTLKEMLLDLEDNIQS